MPRGVVLSILASVMFGAVYFVPVLLAPLTGEEVFGWRALLTVPVVTVLLVSARQWRHVRTTARRVRERPSVLLRLAATSALLGVQLWLFGWAPTHGHGLDVALGYFLMPLAMVAVGVVAFREHLSRWRVWAVLAAAVGVTNEVVRVGSLSWTTLVVALAYPLYFTVRRKAGVATIGGIWFELVLMLPVAVWFIVAGPSLADSGSLVGPLVLLGLLSGAAMICYLVASQVLTFSLFGLLSYLEPILLVVVSVTLLHEGLTVQQWLTYIPINVAILLIGGEGWQQARRMRPFG